MFKKKNCEKVIRITDFNKSYAYIENKQLTKGSIMKSQKERILRHLLKGGTITPLEALTLFNCFRLGARIDELRKAGYPVETELVQMPSGKRVARYEMAGVK
jgi:hypothetical protein